MQKINTLLKVSTYPAAILVLHFLLTYYGGYYWWAHADKVMHVLGGTAIALAAAELVRALETDGSLRIGHKPFYVITLLGLVCLAAVGWEFLEWALDHTVRTRLQAGLTDTMGDLLAGLCGGGVAMAIRFIWKRA